MGIAAPQDCSRVVDKRFVIGRANLTRAGEMCYADADFFASNA
jgi:hypothetical protein